MQKRSGVSKVSVTARSGGLDSLPRLRHGNFRSPLLQWSVFPPLPHGKAGRSEDTCPLFFCLAVCDKLLPLEGPCSGGSAMLSAASVRLVAPLQHPAHLERSD